MNYGPTSSSSNTQRGGPSFLPYRNTWQTDSINDYREDTTHTQYWVSSRSDHHDLRGQHIDASVIGISVQIYKQKSDNFDKISLSHRGKRPVQERMTSKAEIKEVCRLHICFTHYASNHSLCYMVEYVFVIRGRERDARRLWIDVSFLHQLI